MPDQAPDTTEDAKPDFTPITSQEQLNALLGDRLARERAKYSDYDDLKAKAAKFDQAEEANKSELEKATEANNQLRSELEALKLTQLKHDIAAEHGLTAAAAKHLIGTNRDELTESATELKNLIGGQSAVRDEPVPTAGTGDPRRNSGGYDAGAERARKKINH